MRSPMTIASWSAGKDSCLACYKVIRQGYQIRCLLNFISEEFRRCCFHGIEADLIRLQAQAIGIPLVQKAVAPGMEAYEKDFKDAVSGIGGVQAMVFGDIYLNEHKEWVERVCGDMGVTPLEPLWNSSPAALVREFIDAGFRSVVVSCRADTFDKDFVGREVDKDFLRELESRNICPCGENGEFHTLVVDGPMFTRRIEILDSEPVLKEGFWKYWFLDIKRYR